MRDALKGKSLEERIAWTSGRLILSIGNGQFNSELGLLVQVLESNAVARAEEARAAEKPAKRKKR